MTKRREQWSFYRGVSCPVPKGAGSQSVVCVATYSGRPVAARLFIGQR